MTLSVTLLLLLSALLLATWNAAVKKARDRVALATGLYGTCGIVGALALPFVPPMAPEAWPLLALSVVIHAAYKVPMVMMYRQGDLSQVFPFARGFAPLLVTLVAIPTAGEVPAPWTVAGVSLICVGLLGFAWRPQGHVAGLRPILIAGATGVLLSGYWVVDGLGSRAAGSGLAYAAWLFMFDGIVTFAGAYAWRRRALWAGLRGVWPSAAVQGLIAAAGYALVLVAFRLGALGPVAAVGQTSIVFAALIGTLYLGESFGMRRVAFAAIVFAGITVVNLG